MPADAPYRVLYLDLNSYFASVEQQVEPSLRGKPVAVAPVMADSGTCIAASYPAKKFGIKTGTSVREARQRCPGIVIVPARMELYVEYHKKIIAAVESVTIVHKVRSIDEMAIKLDPSERSEPAARALAMKLKAAIREQAGVVLTCSIGVATNEFLAKVAGDLVKPDGLTFMPPEEVPRKLLKLQLTDFPGISSNMERRLHARGITTVAEMYEATEDRLRAVWGGVVGARWYHLIRGEEVAIAETKRRTVGHSHVLAPKYRNEAGVRAVLLRLMQKAAARLRSLGYRARAMQLFVQGSGKEWGAAARFDAACDELTFIEIFSRLWANHDFAGPVAVGVTFHELIAEDDVTPSLFGAVNRRAALGKTLDAIHQRFGRNAIYVAAGHDALDTAEEKIAFLKTELFKEGAGENPALKAKAAALRAMKREKLRR